MTILFLLATLFFFASEAQGYTTFQTTCTTPNTTTSFVSSPDARGTLDILWSCIITFITCTWSALYLNVPEQRNGRDPGWKGDLKWKLKAFWRKFKWFLITIVAPEILVAGNFVDLDCARKGVKLFEDFARIDGVPWTKAHSNLASMGGFCIRYNTCNGRLHSSTTRRVLDDYLNLEAWLDESERAANGITWNSTTNKNWSSDETCKVKRHHKSYASTLHLCMEDLLELRKQNHMRLPNISEEEIMALSRSDVLIRTIAVCQILWFTTQIIKRMTQQIAITQLEVAVLAFAALALLLYGLNWNKPQNIEIPLSVISFPHSPPDGFREKLLPRNEFRETIPNFDDF